MMHAEFEEKVTWITLSAAWLIVGAAATARNAFDYRKLSTTTGQTFPSANNLFWFSTVLGVLALQVYNIIALTAFWPVLLGIAWLFALCCFSFWQLLIRHNQ